MNLKAHSLARKIGRVIKYRVSLLLTHESIPEASTEFAFGIRKGYRHRLDNAYFNAQAQSSEDWQVEVYEYALRKAREVAANVILDMGCGSGYKLRKYFSEFKIVGIDVPETVRKLQAVSGSSTSEIWGTFEEVLRMNISPDIVISADAIEHVPNPDLFMRQLSELDCRHFIISTPERNLLYGFDHGGPPNNNAHCREWTQSEFSSYVGQWFDVVESMVCNKQQCTQLIYATRKPL